MQMAIIYLITNIKNGKQYVGQTRRTIEERFNEHYWSRNRISYRNRPMYIDMNKDGIQNFDYDVLEFNPINANDRERYWIAQLNTLYPYGYNRSIGGDFNLDIDENKIINLYLEKKSINEVFKETKYSRTTIRNILKKYNIDRLTATEVKRQQFGKPIIAINSEPQNNQMVFQNQFDAAKYLINNKITKYTSINSVVSYILRCIKKDIKCYGYKWKFI